MTKAKKTKLALCPFCKHSINHHREPGCMVVIAKEFNFCSCMLSADLVRKHLDGELTLKDTSTNMPKPKKQKVYIVLKEQTSSASYPLEYPEVVVFRTKALANKYAKGLYKSSVVSIIVKAFTVDE